MIFYSLQEYLSWGPRRGLSEPDEIVWKILLYVHTCIFLEFGIIAFYQTVNNNFYMVKNIYLKWFSIVSNFLNVLSPMKENQSQWLLPGSPFRIWVVRIPVSSPYFMDFRSWENQKILVQFNFGLNKLTRGRVWQLTEGWRLDSGPNYFVSVSSTLRYIREFLLEEWELFVC